LVLALIKNIDIIVAFNSWSRGPDENEQVVAFAG
jgi:hypothetical protein